MKALGLGREENNEVGKNQRFIGQIRDGLYDYTQRH